MKATTKNLIEKGILEGKILNLMDFGKENGYFKKEGNQLFQINKEMSLPEAYDKYLNENKKLNLSEYKEVYSGLFLLKKGKNAWFYIKALDSIIQRKIYEGNNIIISGLAIKISL